MKPYFTTPITSLEEAHAHLRKLHEDDLLYHPDDYAETILSDNTGIVFLFSPEEAEQLNQRMAEVFSFDPDPCTFILDELMKSSED